MPAVAVVGVLKGIFETPFKAALSGDINGIQELVKHGADIHIQSEKAEETLLHAAARGGHVEVFVYLTRLGLDPRAITEFDDTVLHLACLNGAFDMVKYIAIEYPDLKNEAGDGKNTALHYTAQCGDIDIFEFLVSQGSDVFSVNEHGRTVLHVACCSGRNEMVKHLVTTYRDLLNKVDNNERSALHCSAFHDDVNVFKLLVDRGLNVYDVTSSGKTVLHEASHRGKHDMVKYLLDTYPDLTTKMTKKKKTALHFWTKASSREVEGLKLLIDHGLAVNSETVDGKTVLHYACARNKQEMVKHLTTYPDLLNKVNKSGESALHMYANHGDVDMFKFLVEKGLSVYDVTKTGKTVLHIASRSGKCDLVKYLLDTYPALTIKITKDNKGALHFWAESYQDNVEGLKLLIEHGVDINSETVNGENVLHYACARNKKEMVKHLMTTYPDLLNKVNNSGESALHMCADNGNMDMFKILVEKGLSVYDVTKTGKTVLHIASRSGKYDLVKYLLETYPALTTMTKDNKGALHFWAKSYQENVEGIKLLIDHGLDVYSATADGKNVLHYACSSGNKKIVTYLLTTYPDLLKKNNNRGESALYKSAAHGNVDMFKFLVDQGLDVYAVTSDNKTVLHVASTFANYDLVKYLLNNYQDLKNQMTKNKMTALHVCAGGKRSKLKVLKDKMTALHVCAGDYRSNLKVLKLLIDSGLDVYSLTDDGKNVLHIAASSCSDDALEMVKYLATNYPDLTTAKTNAGETPLDLTTDTKRQLVISCFQEYMAISLSKPQALCSDPAMEKSKQEWIERFGVHSDKKETCKAQEEKLSFAEEENFYKFSRLLLDTATPVLRKLTEENELRGGMKATIRNDKKLKKTFDRIMTTEEKELIALETSDNIPFARCDISLLTKLLTNFTGISMSMREKVESIRKIRNLNYAHLMKAKLPDDDFKKSWDDLDSTLTEICGGLKSDKEDVLKRVQDQTRKIKSDPLPANISKKLTQYQQLVYFIRTSDTQQVLAEELYCSDCENFHNIGHRMQSLAGQSS